MVVLLLIGMLILTFDIQQVKASGTIFIRADGSIEPSTAPISTIDNVTYILTDNINDSISVGRNSIIVDGAGYTLTGPGIGTGIILSGRSNITVRNMEIKAFDLGIYISFSFNNKVYGNNITGNSRDGILIYHSSNNGVYNNKIVSNIERGIKLDSSSENLVTGNTITDNYKGIMVSSSSNNSVSGNTITSNNYDGLYLHNSHNSSISGNNIITNEGAGIRFYHSSNNTIYHNNIIDNTELVPIYDSTNVWDNGCEGNYWSDYNGTDGNSDGIGDIPYVIDGNNTDQYPLMNRYWNPADINHDLAVDIYDVVIACGAYGSTPSDPHWNPHCDIAEPYGVINIYDVVMICSSYGEEYNP